MYAINLKKSLSLILLFLLLSLACDLSVTVNPLASPVPTNTTLPGSADPTLSPASPTAVPETLAPVPTATLMQPTFEGVEITVDPLRITLSPQVASGARGLQVPRAEGEIAPWELTPGHIQLKLEGYALQGTTHEPQIYVYPALAYAEMHSPAFESIHRLNNIFYDPAAALRGEGLPSVPFFNAAQVFASNIQLISFQNGRGVRFLTEYAQYPAAVNNQDLFYHFQGLTSDGEYFIVAILPIRAPVLAETSDAGAVLPAGGVPYPYFANPEANMEIYYTAVTDLLNATSAEAFTPTIGQLDRLIQSIRIVS